MSEISRRSVLQSAATLGAFIASNVKVFAANETLNVGVVHLGQVGESGWSKQHDLAREAMEAHFNGAVKTTVVTNIVQPQDAERIFRDLANKDHKLIIGTTFSQMAPLLKIAPALPGTKFECNTSVKTLPNMGAFEAKYYEGFYLAGVAAGKASKTKTLGWIGSFPFPNVLMSLNSFILGAHSVDSAIVCKTVWISSWDDPGKEKDALSALAAQGADVVAGTPNTPVQAVAAQDKGIWSVGFASDYGKYAPKGQLTSVVLDWTSAYIQAATGVIDGSWSSNDRWLGLASGGYVKMAPYHSSLGDDAKAILAAKEADIIAGNLHPFAGPLKSQSGETKVAAGQTLADSDIRSMNWLVEGVQGQLPG